MTPSNGVVEGEGAQIRLWPSGRLSGSNQISPFLGLSGDQASSFFTRPDGGDSSVVPLPLPISDPARRKSPADARRARRDVSDGAV